MGDSPAVEALAREFYHWTHRHEERPAWQLVTDVEREPYLQYARGHAAAIRREALLDAAEKVEAMPLIFRAQNSEMAAQDVGRKLAADLLRSLAGGE